jgi:ABC-type transport system substrate-binding protein
VAQWAVAGINAKVEYIEFKDLVRRDVLGLYDASLLRYFASRDPDELWHFFVSDTIGGPVSVNFTGLADKDITDGMNQGRATTDPAVRKPGYEKVQQAMATQMPYLWLQRFEWRVASLERVHNAHNVTLPDGNAAMPLLACTHRLTETWVDH